METVSKEQLILDTLKTLTQSIDELSNQVMSHEQFITTNFRNFTPQYNGIYSKLVLLHTNLKVLEKLTKNNADNAHLLSSSEDNVDNGVRIVESRGEWMPPW